MRKSVSARLFFVLFGSIFAGIGAIFLIVSIVLMVDNQNFKSKADKIVGIITEINTYYDSDDDLNHEVWVSYQYNGETYESRLSEYSSSMYEGGRIDLYVDPENPHKVRSGSAATILFFIFGGLGLVFFLIGSGFLVKEILHKSKQKQLKQNGRKLRATITGGDMCYTITINNRHPYKLDCMYQDEFTKESYLFSSDYVFDPPENYIDAQVDVYVDPNEMSKYYVDMDSLSNRNPMLHDFRN